MNEMKENCKRNTKCGHVILNRRLEEKTYRKLNEIYTKNTR